MPNRHYVDPCNNERPAYDIAGRINDLINCYLKQGKVWVDTVLPQTVVAIILVAVMILAAYMFLKE